MINREQITIGTDIEFFVVNENNESVSVEGFLGGSKTEPLDIGNGCFRQEDNVNAEFSMQPVKFKDVQTFIEQIEYCRNKGNEILGENGLHLLAGSSREIPEKYLKTDQARTFGCDPSYCVYTQDITKIPPAEEVGNLRTCGFHLHVGFPVPEDRSYMYQTTEHLIRMFDLYIGVTSVIVDLDTNRRQVYGNAGDFRFRLLNNDTIFVFEYRSLGGSLLANTDTVAYAFNQLCLAIDNYFDGKIDFVKLIHNEERIMNCMKEGNVTDAEEILKDFGLEIPSVSVFEENIVNHLNLVHA